MTVQILNEKKHQARILAITAVVVLTGLLGTNAYAIAQSHSLTSCNKKTVVNLQRYTAYSSQIAAQNNKRNAALLSLLQASSNTTTGVAFVDAIKNSPDWDTARARILDALTANPGNRDAILQAYNAYQEADKTQKAIQVQRDKVKLPKLSDCL